MPSISLVQSNVSPSTKKIDVYVCRYSKQLKIIIYRIIQNYIWHTDVKQLFHGNSISSKDQQLLADWELSKNIIEECKII